MKKIKVNRRIYIALSKVFEKYDRATVLKLHESNPNSWRGDATPLNGMPFEQLKAITDFSFELDEPKKISEIFTEFFESLKKEEPRKVISVSIALGRALDLVMKEHDYDHDEVLLVHSLVKGEYVGQAKILNGVKYSDLKTILESGYHYENREDGHMGEKRFIVSVEVEQALDYLLYEREVSKQKLYLTHKKESGVWTGDAEALNKVSSILVKHALEQDYCSLDTRWDGKIIVIPQAAAKALDNLVKECEHSKDFILKRYKNCEKYRLDSDFQALAEYLDMATLKKALTYGYVANGVDGVDGVMGTNGKIKAPLAPKKERKTNLDNRGLKELQLAFEDVAALTNDAEWMRELLQR